MTTTTIPRNRSLKFEDHTGLIHKKAQLYYARLLAAQVISVTFDDVYSELSVAFVKATRGYDTESEFTFTAYLGMCMQNHFNKFAKKLMLEQYGEESLTENSVGGLGYISIEDLTGRTGDGDSLTVGYDLFEDDTFTRPDEVCDAVSQLNAVINDVTLSAETRVYISLIANPSMAVSPAVQKRIHQAAAKIKSEVSQRFGTTIKRIHL